ncbi:hypothetical protein PG988_012499 [Apiospora saccharicola]
MLAMLRLAARRGNTELVDFLLPMVSPAPLQSLLAAAIKSGETRLVNRLLEIGATADGPASAPITLSDENEELSFLAEMTPLAQAILCQDEVLISRIETLNALSCIGRGNKKHFEAATTAAAYTGNLRYLQKLCEQVSGLNDNYLSNALLVAIANDHYDIVSYLIHEHAGILGTGSSRAGEGIISSAISNKNQPVFELLMEFLPRFRIDSHIMTAAVLWGNQEVLECLLQSGADVNYTYDFGPGRPLSMTALAGDRVMSKWLLEHGANPNTASLNGALSPLALAALQADSEMVDLLLSHKANVRDDLALVFAMSYSQEIFMTLLSAFASQFTEGLPGFGGIVLSRAVCDMNIHQVNQLLQARMDINASPQSILAFYDIDKRLKYSKASCGDRVKYQRKMLQNLEGMSALGHAITANSNRGEEQVGLVRILLEDGGDPEKCARRDPPSTALLLAIEHKNIAVMELLVEYGADVNRPARQGIRYSPLQLACEIRSLEMVEFLLQRGADVRAAPSMADGGTALQMAARSGNIMIAQLLLDNEANVHESPSKINGRTAFEGAAKEGRITMLEFLWAQACPAGFPPPQLERARSFAEEECHRGCVEYIDLLLMIVGDARTPRLSD